MAIGLRAGHPHDDREFASGRGGARAEPLASGDHVLVAITLDPGPYVGGVRAGYVRLCHRETRPDLALEKRMEPRLLLLRCAEHMEDLHIPGVRRRAVEGFGSKRDAATGDLG